MSEQDTDHSSRFWDSGYDTTTPTTFECLNCGATIVSEDSIGTCERCGGGLRNKSMPIE
ncbi:rubrerythrin-like domain-containing protein [Halalkalirubrum salinum]|uniref:rubrerythrin-like domain-containing protein n=1 Tax=Halalkalirubrum salinum TaxID=2563889 RepID=UPI0010C0A8E7|nr:rubrerythrin-like domain-containing protein [Halalkalirubrum salinum]